MLCQTARTQVGLRVAQGISTSMDRVQYLQVWSLRVPPHASLPTCKSKEVSYAQENLGP